MRAFIAALLTSVPAVAFAQAADPAVTPAAASPIMSLLPLAGIVVVFYFLLLRPQQKRMKEHQALLGGLKKGDEVVTGGGIIGKITKIGETDTFTVEIAKGVEVTVLKSTVTSLVGAPKPVVTEKKKAAGDKNDNAVVSRNSVANDN